MVTYTVLPTIRPGKDFNNDLFTAKKPACGPP